MIPTSQGLRKDQIRLWLSQCLEYSKVQYIFQWIRYITITCIFRHLLKPDGPSIIFLFFSILSPSHFSKKKFMLLAFSCQLINPWPCGHQSLCYSEKSLSVSLITSIQMTFKSASWCQKALPSLEPNSNCLLDMEPILGLQCSFSISTKQRLSSLQHARKFLKCYLLIRPLSLSIPSLQEYTRSLLLVWQKQIC